MGEASGKAPGTFEGASPGDFSRPRTAPGTDHRPGKPHVGGVSAATRRDEPCRSYPGFCNYRHHDPPSRWRCASLVATLGEVMNDLRRGGGHWKG